MPESPSKPPSRAGKQRASREDYVPDIPGTFKPGLTLDPESALAKSFGQLDINPYSLKSVEQLQWLAEHDPTKFLKDIENMRVVMEDDNISHIVTNWNAITKSNEELASANSVLTLQNEGYLREKEELITQAKMATEERRPRDRKDKSKTPGRSAKFPDPPTLTDGVDPPYDTWKLRANDKLRNNADWWPTAVEKANVLISLTKDISAKHIDARRLDAPDFYTCPADVFAVLDSLYLNKNRLRDARRRFGALQMRPGQSFSAFYSDFILLANQLTDYSEKTKVDSLEEKITGQLQRAIASSGEFETLEDLKDHLQIVDTRLSNIRPEASSKTDSKGRYTTKRTTVTATGTALPDRLAIPKDTRAASGTERKALQNIRTRLNGKGCWSCGDPDHFKENCPHGPGNGWLTKEVKKEIDAIELAAMELHMIGSADQASDASSTSSDSESDSEN